ncbi:hypothetical protein FD04_GL001849 [Secundilactobacillus odoratitofui DSM 19909 = JCM 15043]|uniref:N-acetyltransferase domain-containing protein n=1 Tax=Secundilactobacillus odoratitofui DSM 19909 = JCM 15043 TaxID=1423776 RepID=A0A0R1LVM3_9LACO|nr:GNAT family N-acetyltransferase [Secundilactobacillus odoratitofui]KRK96993.1 hypothetical protein FD04_GL001849 [Secundilactobacillus odoratitofui DSM 19909 = JCM 15043]
MEVKSGTGMSNAVYQDASQIRQQVFVTEQGIDAQLEFDGLDDQTTHYVGYVSQTPVTTARLKVEQGVVHIQRVATVEQYRHHGYAAQLLQQIIKTCDSGTLITLNAQATAVGLYEQLGFERTGQPFEEVGIKHYAMTLKR